MPCPCSMKFKGGASSTKVRKTTKAKAKKATRKGKSKGKRGSRRH